MCLERGQAQDPSLSISGFREAKRVGYSREGLGVCGVVRFRSYVFANPGAALLPTEAAYAAGTWAGFSKHGPVQS